MNRIALSLAFVLAAAAAHVPHAWADEPPSREQIEAAKKAFGEGKALHDQGKLGAAVEKFKESYRLSRSPILLYNIALTLDENKQTDSALFYYRKFLSDAPADAAQRHAADERVKSLENAKLDAELSTKGGGDQEAPKNPGKTGGKKIKPAGTYGATDFSHEVIEDAPPGKPLDFVASAPDDSGWVVTLYYRTAGSDYRAKVMKRHGDSLIARIPPGKVSGSAIQYYIEVKDAGDKVVTRSGKSTSPNLINLDASAAQHTVADYIDTSEGASTTAGGGETPAKPHHDVDEDPLSGGGTTGATGGTTEPPAGGDNTTPATTEATGTGFLDPGSAKFRGTKWGFTAGAVAFVALGVTFNVMAGKDATAIVSDSQTPHGTCITVPCKYDGYDQGLQSDGERNQTISNVTFGIGIAAAVVAGYFWYRDLTHKHTEVKASDKPAASPEEPTFMIAPTIGQDFHGAAAAVRF